LYGCLETPLFPPLSFFFPHKTVPSWHWFFVTPIFWLAFFPLTYVNRV
jgi:hypothetical protein